MFKIIDMHIQFTDGIDFNVYNLTLYAAFNLATTLCCTLLIIYRILSVGRANSGAGGGLRAYRHVIKVLVESSALYSICTIMYMACSAANYSGQYYIDGIILITRV